MKPVVVVLTPSMDFDRKDTSSTVSYTHLDVYKRQVLHALTKDREQRYQTAAQFRADLSALRSHQPVSDAAMASLASYAAGGGGGVARSGPGLSLIHI